MHTKGDKKTFTKLKQMEKYILKDYKFLQDYVILDIGTHLHMSMDAGNYGNNK